MPQLSFTPAPSTFHRTPLSPTSTTTRTTTSCNPLTYHNHTSREILSGVPSWPTRHEQWHPFRSSAPTVVRRQERTVEATGTPDGVAGWIERCRTTRRNPAVRHHTYTRRQVAQHPSKAAETPVRSRSVAAFYRDPVTPVVSVNEPSQPSHRFPDSTAQRDGPKHLPGGRTTVGKVLPGKGFTTPGSPTRPSFREFPLSQTSRPQSSPSPVRHRAPLTDATSGSVNVPSRADMVGDVDGRHRVKGSSSRSLSRRRGSISKPHIRTVEKPQSHSLFQLSGFGRSSTMPTPSISTIPTTTSTPQWQSRSGSQEEADTAIHAMTRVNTISSESSIPIDKSLSSAFASLSSSALTKNGRQESKSKFAPPLESATADITPRVNLTTPVLPTLQRANTAPLSSRNIRRKPTKNYTQCSSCNMPLVNDRGHARFLYHPLHPDEVLCFNCSSAPSCFCCERRVEVVPVGSLHMCKRCRDASPIKQHRINAVRTRVSSFMQKNIKGYNPERFKWIPINLQEKITVGKETHISGCPINNDSVTFGICLCAYSYSGARLQNEKRIVSGIAILSFLPEVIFAAFLAHELLHAYYHLDGPRHRDNDLEEKNCCVISILCLKAEKVRLTSLLSKELKTEVPLGVEEFSRFAHHTLRNKGASSTVKASVKSRELVDLWLKKLTTKSEFDRPPGPVGLNNLINFLHQKNWSPNYP